MIIAINWELIFQVSGAIIIIFMVCAVITYGIMLIISLIQVKRNYSYESHLTYEEFLGSSFIKPVSILVPAFNESRGIYDCIRSLLSIEYPEYEIIVINDGSTDNTLEMLINYFECKPIYMVIRQQLKTETINGVYQSSIYPDLYIIDKENGGKADALNAGINLSNFPYIGSLDGDSIIERNAFIKVIKPLLESNHSVIAAGGSVRVANGNKIDTGEFVEAGLSRNPLVLLQVIEYLRAFLIGRIGLSN